MISKKQLTKWKDEHEYMALLRRDRNRLRAWARRAKVVLDLIDYDGKRAEVILAPEDAKVLELCEHIGYGAVMDSVARQWFAKDRHGAHTVGPCAATVRSLRSDLDDALAGKAAPRRGGRR
jgi:hypothetical protein